MSKIAALILPPSRSKELVGLCSEMASLLRAAGGVEKATYAGSRAVCGLVRAGGDALNPQPQPVAAEQGAGVACGYYTREAHDGHTPAAADSAQRLVTDALARPDHLRRNDGVYAYACWDARREELVAGVDKLGMRPLFWAAVKGGGYAVASEVKALMPVIGDIEPDWQAWEEYLTFGFLFGNHTQFSGISRVGAAEVIRCGTSRSESCTREDFLRDIEIRDRSFDEFIEEQTEVFDRTMARLSSLYDARRDTLLTLSGGYDSRRAMAWLLQNDISFNAWTIPEIQSDGTEFESGIVRELCVRAGIDGYAVYPRSSRERANIGLLRTIATDFESDEHNFSMILTEAIAAQNKVNFDGLGAGSQLMGSFMRPEYFAPDGRARFAADWPPTAARFIRLPRSEPPLAVRLQSELDQWGDHPNRFAYFYLMSRTRREVSLAPLSIQATVFESVCPYLDRQMMRSALSFPPHKKVGAELQRRLVGAASPALAKVPFAQDITAANAAAYSQFMGSIDRRARSRCFSTVALGGWGGKDVAIPLRQRLDFAVCRYLPWLVPGSALRWKISKAERYSQLAWFLSAAKTGADYRDEVVAKKSLSGPTAAWIKKLS